MNINNNWLIVLTISLFFTLSLVSGYNLISPYSVNWDIALMLTPYGLLKNLLVSETYLTPYYWKVTPRDGIWDQWSLGLGLIGLEISAILLFFKKGRE